MLPKKNKLPIGLFPASSKTIFRGEYFIIKSNHNNLGFARFGVTFKSKAFKTAVSRNRLKRIVFDFFRLQATSYKLQAGIDLLVILNPSIINLVKNQIDDELNKALKSILKTHGNTV